MGIGIVGGPAQPIVIYDINGNPINLSGLPNGTGQKTVNGSMGVVLTGDLTPGDNFSCDITLPVADTVYSFKVPIAAKGCQILSPSARIRFNLNATTLPTAYSTANASNTTDFAYLGAYNSVAAGKDSPRIFTDPVRPTQINFNTETAGATFTLEFF